MGSLTFLFGVALFAGAVLYFVLQPILMGRHAPMERDDDEMTDVEAHRRVTLMALRDVEYDRETGKLDEEDYRSLRKELSSEALAALEAERDEGRAGALSAGAVRDSVAVDLEDEIRRVRAGLAAGNTCRTCGHVNPGGSRFCSGCGGTLGSAGRGDTAPAG